ncbi:kinase-like domain, phloem protein 2-like protein, partial [Tanacetum coccineum]
NLKGVAHVIRRDSRAWHERRFYAYCYESVTSALALLECEASIKAHVYIEWLIMFIEKSIDKVGETYEEKDKVLLQLDQECLDVRRDNQQAWIPNSWWTDGLGNVHGRIQPPNASNEALLLGFHLDTVVDAAMFDGALGVISAISALKVLNVTGRLRHIKHPVEIIKQIHTMMMSSVNHDDFAHLRIPLEDVLSATTNFSDNNLLGEDASEKDYKGQLLWSGDLIDIYARRLNKEWFDGDQEFWMEISLLSTLKHKNLASLVGFCDDNDEKVIIYKLDTRRPIYNHLSDLMSLTWVRRLEICVGIAQALSYIHYDESRDFSTIHRNINSCTVCLNDDWEPKLYGFECSMKINASQRHHSFNNGACHYVPGYVDSTFLKANTVSHKSDMYSFGILLFELLCGRRSIIESDTDKYLAPLAVTHYREKRLYEIIDWDLWQQMDSRSFNIFAETAYDCLKEERSKRPNIDEIVTKLEKALEHQKAVILFSSSIFLSL